MNGIFDVKRAEIFHNEDKLTPAQVKAIKGCQIVINGWMFDMVKSSVNYFRPCGWLVMNGKVLYRDQYKDYGFAVDAEGHASMSTDRDHNFISAYPLMRGGKYLRRPCDRNFAALKERVAIGWNKDGKMVIWCDKRRMTVPQLFTAMSKLGAVDAVVFDCGGSVQGVFPDCTVHSSRPVATMICLWLNEPERKPGPDKDVGTTNQQKRDRVLNWAESQLGVIEFPLGSNKVKYNDWYYGAPGHNYAWCVTFVQWVFAKAGLPLPLKTASCTQLANWAKAHGQWVSRDYKPGDVVMFHWGKDKSVTEHMGIVKEVHGPQLITIEGNTSTKDQSNGGCVMERTRALVSVTGAYRPWYNV